MEFNRTDSNGLTDIRNWYMQGSGSISRCHVAACNVKTRMNSCDLCARWSVLTRANSSSSLTHTSPLVGTSEGPRDVLSKEQLSLLVWTRWVVRMLPYCLAQLRAAQRTHQGWKEGRPDVRSASQAYFIVLFLGTYIRIVV